MNQLLDWVNKTILSTTYNHPSPHIELPMLPMPPMPPMLFIRTLLQSLALKRQGNMDQARESGVTATVMQLKSHDRRARRPSVRQASISKLPIHKFLPLSFQKGGAASYFIAYFPAYKSMNTWHMGRVIESGSCLMYLRPLLKVRIAIIQSLPLKCNHSLSRSEVLLGQATTARPAQPVEWDHCGILFCPGPRDEQNIDRERSPQPQ